MEQPVDTFRSSTWGWLRGTLAGWGTIALAAALLSLVRWYYNRLFSEEDVMDATSLVRTSDLKRSAS